MEFYPVFLVIEHTRVVLVVLVVLERKFSLFFFCSLSLSLYYVLVLSPPLAHNLAAE